MHTLLPSITIRKAQMNNTGKRENAKAANYFTNC